MKAEDPAPATVGGTALDANFFDRATPKVARELIGMSLVRRMPGGATVAQIITETEAYDGPRDLACHASKGRTPRTAVMFGPPGHWYVYFVYGMHWMLNIVTGPVDYPAAVLIRATADVSGPARLTKRMEIGGAVNALPALPASGLWIEDRGIRVPARQIERTPRIGVGYAGEVWAAKPWRFVRRNS